MLRYAVALCLFLSCVWAKNEIYDGHSLYEVTIDNENVAKALGILEERLGVDVWGHPIPGSTTSVLVPAIVKDVFLGHLDEMGVQYRLEVENIKELIDLEESMLAAAANNTSRDQSRIGLSFDTIHRYAAVDAYLVELERRFPHLVRTVSGGRSVEGRDIKYLRISTTNFQDQNKPIVYMESLLHAREWVTLPSTLYAIEKLLIDVTEQDLVRNIDWIIVPIANPDGYEHTHTSARFWRKNRATGFMAGNVCMGVDLNRNFDFNFGTGSSNSVCSETFHGSRANSEPETRVIDQIVRAHSRRIELFLDIHSYGSYILYGYGTGVLPPNGLTIHTAGVQMAQAIDRVKWPSNRNYIVGNSNHVLYGTSGSAQDYAQISGCTLSYTYELPAYRNSGGTNGFLVDPTFIRQAGFETWEGIKVGARFALNNFRARRSMKTTVEQE